MHVYGRSNGPTALNYLLELPLLDEVSRESFLTRDTVCDHIHSYAKTFGLLSLIKVHKPDTYGILVYSGGIRPLWAMVCSKSAEHHVNLLLCSVKLLMEKNSLTASQKHELRIVIKNHIHAEHELILRSRKTFWSAMITCLIQFGAYALCTRQTRCAER